MVSRHEFLNSLLSEKENAQYLEVGVSKGETFFAIDAGFKVAVDPEFQFDPIAAAEQYSNAEFHQVPSDVYFRDIVPQSKKFDLIYLDGLHTFEQTLRDFTNAIEHLDAAGVIVIDDVVPSSYNASLPDWTDTSLLKKRYNDQDNSWMGDTYKLVYFIETFYPAYNIMTIADNHGQAVIWRTKDRRTPSKYYTIKDLGDLSFVDTVRSEKIFNKQSSATILAEITHERNQLLGDRAGDPINDESSAPLRMNVIGTVERRLVESTDVSVPSALVYENIGDFDVSFRNHMANDVYTARNAALLPVDLISLGRATIYPGSDFAVHASGHLVEEQVPPWPVSVNRSVPEKKISENVMIIARYGFDTWGHWLGEMLPKIVLAERACPQRFKFAVPAAYEEPKFANFLGSLAAYGITRDRLLFLDGAYSYRLDRAWGVTSVWSDYLLHPAAAEAMRQQFGQHSSADSHTRVSLTSAYSHRRVALTRGTNAERQIANWSDISNTLQSAGFTIVDPASLDFRSQVELFSSAETIVSTLGSGLTGLIYSPAGVKVLSLAPSFFGDRFFYALILDRRGRYADVRGQIVDPHPSIPHRGSFAVDVNALQDGLKNLLTT